jgi:hypothetical protein
MLKFFFPKNVKENEKSFIKQFFKGLLCKLLFSERKSILKFQENHKNATAPVFFYLLKNFAILAVFYRF